MIAKLLIPFVVLIFASVPIAFSQGLASLFLMSVEDVISGESFVKGITAGLNSFTLAAVPLFTFAGDIMGKGGISRRLLDLGCNRCMYVLCCDFWYRFCYGGGHRFDYDSCHGKCRL